MGQRRLRADKALRFAQGVNPNRGNNLNRGDKPNRLKEGDAVEGPVAELDLADDVLLWHGSEHS